MNEAKTTDTRTALGRSEQLGGAAASIYLERIPANAPEQIAALKAEVARVTEERDTWQAHYQESLDAHIFEIERAKKAEAELAAARAEIGGLKADLAVAQAFGRDQERKHAAARADAEALAGALGEVMGAYHHSCQVGHLYSCGACPERHECIMAPGYGALAKYREANG